MFIIIHSNSNKSCGVISLYTSHKYGLNLSLGFDPFLSPPRPDPKDEPNFHFKRGRRYPQHDHLGFRHRFRHVRCRDAETRCRYLDHDCNETESDRRIDQIRVPDFVEGFKAIAQGREGRLGFLDP